VIRIRYLFCLMVCGLLALAALPADGHVLQGPHVLDLMVTKIGQARSLLVHQRLMLPESEPGLPAAEVKEVLRYRFPKAFRSDLEAREMQRIHVVSGERSLTVVNGRIEAQPPGRVDIYKDVLLYRSRLDLHKALARLGINVSACSLGRYEGQIGFVIGAQYPDEGVSQLWVDKESLVPMRLLMVTPAESPDGRGELNRLDIVYSDWRKFGKILYPMRVSFYRNGTLLRELQVDNVQVNPVVDEDVMDVQRLAALYQRTENQPEAPVETEAEDDIQKTINDFKKKFEETEPR
jgi:hypothetical protein